MSPLSCVWVCVQVCVEGSGGEGCVSFHNLIVTFVVWSPMEVLAGLGEHAVPFAVDVIALFKNPEGHVRLAAVLAHVLCVCAWCCGRRGFEKGQNKEAEGPVGEWGGRTHAHRPAHTYTHTHTSSPHSTDTRTDTLTHKHNF